MERNTKDYDLRKRNPGEKKNTAKTGSLKRGKSFSDKRRTNNIIPLQRGIARAAKAVVKVNSNNICRYFTNSGGKKGEEKLP
jgi:hypothetical protein